MVSKHRRKLNQLNESRQILTAVSSKLEDERVPLKGFESLYEVTRKGDVYSKRLGRFIRHKASPNPMSHSVYIEFNVDGKKHQLTIGEVVADHFLTGAQQAEIASKIPDDVDEPRKLWANGFIYGIAKEYNVSQDAIYFVMKRDFNLTRNPAPSIPSF